MKSTGIIRNVDDLGRIVIPKELRTSLNMTEGAPLEMYIEGNNLILTRVYKGCYFCDSTAELTDFNGKSVCAACIEKIKAL